MSLRIRRGGVSAPEVPPGSEVYGPVDGANTIRLGVGPRTVADPGGVSFATIPALVTAIGANPPNTNFVATATSYSVTSNGQITWALGKRPRIYFPGAPASRTITSTGDFTGISAPNPAGGAETDAYFEVHGGKWIGFGTNGSLNSRAAFVRRGPCLIEDTEVSASMKALGGGAFTGDFSGHGLSGELVSVRYNWFHDNWLAGIDDGGYGDAGGGHQQNYLLEWNEIDHNNQGLNSPGNSASGSKLLFVVGNFRYNWSHDNIAWGLWWDTANKAGAGFQVQTDGAIHIHDNVLENNARPGLFFERSGYGRLNNNYTTGNGNGGTINVQPETTSNSWEFLYRNSQHGEVDHNDIDGAKRMFVVANQAEEQSKFVTIHHNRIWLRDATGKVGGYDDNVTNPDTLWAEPITWDSNLYKVASLSTPYWQWGAGEPALTWSQWQSQQSGFDLTSTREVI